MSRQDDTLLVDDSGFSNDYMNSLSKVRRDIIEDCMVELGYPVITLYLTQYQISRLIDFSVRKCVTKACPTFLVLLNASIGCIDVSEYKMEAVRQIYEADVNKSSSNSNNSNSNNTDASNNLVVNENGDSCSHPLTGCDICNKLCQYRMYSYGGMTDNMGRSRLYDMLSWQYASSEMNNLLLNDWYLDQAEQKLYIDGFDGLVTVEYVKEECTIEDLKSKSQWKSWVRDYTLALCKITEGRIRSKYKISSGVFEIESDELISEGTSEKQELEEKLNEDMGYWNIMRG